MKRPNIGITLDWEKEGSFSKRPYYALREHYFHAVYQTGGLPVAIPHIKEGIGNYLAGVQGLIVPGGEFAAPKEWYVASAEPFAYQPSPRMAFDRDILAQALAKDLPVLGICAGMQFMGCVQGCKMTRSVHTYMKTTINHWDGKPAEETAHDIHITPGTLLAKAAGAGTFAINSHHQEALVEIAEGVVVNALAPDGVVEGIELPGYRFALGVQWHPEYLVSSIDKAIFRAFVEAAGAKP